MAFIIRNPVTGMYGTLILMLRIFLIFYLLQFIFMTTFFLLMCHVRISIAHMDSESVVEAGIGQMLSSLVHDDAAVLDVSSLYIP